MFLDGGKIVKSLIALAGASFLLLSLPTSSQGQDITSCTRCARQQKGFQESGIRRWCEQWQPKCYPGKTKK
jgi:hypothetical protein